MKNTILFLSFILLSTLTQAQKLSFDETVNYLNEKISQYESSENVDGKEITANKDGFFEKKFKHPAGTQITNVNLKNTEILAQNDNSLGVIKIYFKCNGDCTQYYFMKNDGTKSSYNSNARIAFYFKNKIEAEKVRKAFIHLQSLMKQIKEPF